MTRIPRHGGLGPLVLAPHSVHTPFVDYRRDRYGNPIHDQDADRYAALFAALAGAEFAGTGGIELGGYDQRIAEWLAGWDTPTVGTVVCWLRRIRAASVHDAIRAGHGSKGHRGGDRP
jgi:hypothetical protein